MKALTKLSLLTALTASCLSFAHAQTTYLIDFNEGAGDSRPGGTWNEYDTPTNIDGSVIVDSTNTSSAITLSKSGTIKDSSNTGTTKAFNNATGGPAWVTTDGSLANTGAAADYFFTDNGSVASFTITYGNLNEGDTVNLDLWASRADTTSGIGYYSYSLDGTNWFGFDVLNKDGSASSANGRDSIAWNTTDTLEQEFRAQIDGNDNARYMNASSLTIGASEALYVKAQDITSGFWTPISAMRLTVIPEPSSYALLAGISGLAWVVLRRRRA